MSSLLKIYINGTEFLKYDKNTRIPGKQRQYLDGMDLDIDEGIELNGEIINSPNKEQRANYVAMSSLLYAIGQQSEDMISATCAYLASHLPELKQIRATEEGEEIIMDLIFDEVN